MEEIRDKKINVFLDDCRRPADISYMPSNYIYFVESFTQTSNFIEFRDLIDSILEAGLSQNINILSFDHDLHLSHYTDHFKPDYSVMTEDCYTGYHCLEYYLNAMREHGLKPKDGSINIHTMNGYGMKNMIDLLDREDMRSALNRTTPDKYLCY